MRDPKSTAAPPSALPEDVLLEILARLPAATDLFRCAVACRRWRALVADPSFLRRRWPDGARCPSSLLGFFGQERCRQHGEENSPPPCFVSAPGSVLGSERPFLASFVPGAADLFDSAVPLASHRGLLLVRFAPSPAGDAGAEPPSVDHLAVCNLHSGNCDVLPPLEHSWFYDYAGTSAYAVVNQGPTSFKVLIVGYNNEGHYRYDVCSYTSGEPGWSARTKLFDPIEHEIFGPFKQRGAVVRHGTAHWIIWSLVDFYSVDMDAATGRVSLHKLPAPRHDVAYHDYDMPRLSVAADETALSCLCLFRKPLQVETWTRGGGDDGENDGQQWRRARVVELRPPEQKKMEKEEPVCMCWGERSGTMLIKDRRRCMYIADLESGAMEEATEKHFCRGLDGYKTAFPIEIDWPTLFMCRLGAKSDA